MQEAFTLPAADTRVVPVKFASRSTQGRVTVTGTGPLKTWRKTVAVAGCPSPAPVAAEVVPADACGGSVQFSAPNVWVTNQIDKAVDVAVTVSAELDGAGAAAAIALGAGERAVVPVTFVGDSASGHVTVAARPAAWTGEWWSTVVAVARVDLRPLLFYTNMYYTDDEIFVTDQRAWQLRVAVGNRLRFTFPGAAADLIPDGVVPALEADPDHPGFYRAKDPHAGYHVTVKKSLIPLLDNADMRVAISGDVDGVPATRCYAFAVRYRPERTACNFPLQLPNGGRGSSGATYEFSIAAAPAGGRVPVSVKYSCGSCLLFSVCMCMAVVAAGHSTVAKHCSNHLFPHCQWPLAWFSGSDSHQWQALPLPQQQHYRQR